MSNQRVQTISGKTPIILVAPHGYKADDENTALLTELMAKNMNCYAVINWGFERAENADQVNDKADCNNVYHCTKPVIKDEFLDPIIRYKNRILMTESEVFIFYIHGMGNKHRVIAKDPKLDMVIGYGAGSPNSFSCEVWQKNLLLHLLKKNGFCAYEGKAGGVMSGWARSNLNQYFRKWEPETEVNSMQIEIIYDLRDSSHSITSTARDLSNALCNILKYTSFNDGVTYKSY